MNAARTQLHVIFSPSAAGTLRRGLELAGREDPVLAPFDDFSFGPIDTDDAEARIQWVEDVLGYSGWRQVCEDSLPVLTASVAAAAPPIVWVSPDCAKSVAGFLWWLSHMQDRECSLVEVRRVHELDHIVLTAHLDSATPLSVARRASALALWAQLQRENAPLRTLSETGLISAPLDHFDTALLAYVTAEWQRMAVVVGYTLAGFDETGVYQADSLILGPRLYDLADAGVLEFRGNTDSMVECDVRLLTQV